MINKVVIVYAIIDDLLGETHAEVSSARFHPLLKAIGHQEDSRSRMSDAEVMTSAITAAMFFGGNHQDGCDYLKQHNLIPNMLEKSRFNRRWHRLAMLMNDLFHQLGMVFKEINEGTEHS